MNTYEITCNAIALVTVTVQANSREEASDLAFAATSALPARVLAGDLSIGFEDWAAEGAPAEVSA